MRKELEILIEELLHNQERASESSVIQSAITFTRDQYRKVMDRDILLALSAGLRASLRKTYGLIEEVQQSIERAWALPYRTEAEIMAKYVA